MRSCALLLLLAAGCDAPVLELGPTIADGGSVAASTGAPTDADLEQYAAVGAMTDGNAHMAHSHFIATQGGGVSFAENEIPWWPLSSYGTVHQIITNGLQLMWSEGPGGGHYDNMTGAYTELGCGVYVSGDETTVTQDYR